MMTSKGKQASTVKASSYWKAHHSEDVVLDRNGFCLWQKRIEKERFNTGRCYELILRKNKELIYNMINDSNGRNTSLRCSLSILKFLKLGGIIQRPPLARAKCRSDDEYNMPHGGL
ncbi:MAG: transposase [Candidatus Magnetominusculus sp. LBB02]|nr:transposase [Candidatus Magnetominusculus sp. LBB02]